MVYKDAYTPELPDDWAILSEDPISTARIGQEWLEAGETLAMRVSSVVCPADFNLLLNPTHPQFDASVKVVSKELFNVDSRLFG
ncbi:RES family NAD+ phosphorylase [Burkholderia gladioli]|uniref:RES family NAD+ phosphorylase n=1 Tax=Burkholderia gladioli TaxID=28095 RepID=UPI001C5EDBD8|nr:RES family NAD+ phosphorylase [Burkholderia gladioli]